MLRKTLLATSVALAAVGVAACGGGSDAVATVPGTNYTAARALATATPIKHVVVLYQENVSFDHYFATYPNATNPTGEPAFTAKTGTTTPNNLVKANLLTNNPNYTNTANGTDAAEPFRLDRTQAATADQNHAYTAEQQAYDGGLADLFPKYTGKGTTGGVGAFGTKGQVMGYYDGNTVTGLWNYAQNFAMSDDAYTDTYGPSTPGALEAVSGQTNGMIIGASSKQPFTMAAYSYYINDGQGGYTMINDVDPSGDVCSSTTDNVMMSGKNIGDLLNGKNISWGGFMGGFNLTVTNPNGTTGCKRSTFSPVVNQPVPDYIQHHNWFQYYKSTANPTHARPSSTLAIGHTLETDGKTTDPANHEYGLQDFFAAVKAGNMPAVAYLKAPAFEDGHAGYSDPLDEQAFVTQVVNFLEQQPQWSSTAVIVTWDDSDGWYDHAFANTTNPSFDSQADQLNGSGVCGKGTPLNGVNGKPVNGRCGPGTRIPFLVISPWAKSNYISNTPISQASIVRFIEDNWLGGERLGGGSFDATAGSIMDLFNFNQAAGTKTFIDPVQGTVLSQPPAGSLSPAFNVSLFSKQS
ncbi:phospholipase C [Thiomonas bhubaneswarensis]|uniref:Phospholipase C n=1 Tax=Thiomonas bhubaneswarensis TaxID=339866 RepID=A0A0K6HRL8_9BURK|nr:alkaline phosphatase family protein [Thiomonas bhubaneswarensis]CUA93428.1 Phospholipase C [Thiomonas bhubaneswarensis]